MYCLVIVRTSLWGVRFRAGIMGRYPIRMSAHFAPVRPGFGTKKEREMVTMPLPASESAPEDDGHRERREQLLQARTFRLEQLAGVERELADAPQHSIQRALHMAATTALAEIDAALDRIERGVYGKCVTCARPMPEDRLDVLPMASQCMPCHYNEQNCRLDGRV